MGTRNVIMVYNHEGIKKVAQYGQWDGYPRGVGIKILNFLKDKEMLSSFIYNLNKVRFLDNKGRDKEFAESYDNNAPVWSNDPDKRTIEQKHWFDTYCTRDLSEQVLINIAKSIDHEIILIDREDTGKGANSWVEYCYVINLKENTFAIHSHLDIEPMKVYNLDDLPDSKTFLSELEGED